MRKILFFSATLVAMVFMTLSFNSCKKDKAVATPTSLDGTSWKVQDNLGGKTIAMVVSFTATDYKTEQYIDEKFDQITSQGQYSYDTKGQGIFDPEKPYSSSFTVSGNVLTDESGIKYTKQ